MGASCYVVYLPNVRGPYLPFGYLLPVMRHHAAGATQICEARDIIVIAPVPSPVPEQPRLVSEKTLYFPDRIYADVHGRKRLGSMVRHRQI